MELNIYNILSIALISIFWVDFMVIFISIKNYF